MKVIKIKNSCGGSGCNVPAHEKILPRLIKMFPVVKIRKAA